MRKVVVPVSLLAVALGVWLSNRQPAFDGAPPESIVTTPVVTPSPEHRPVVQAESVEAIAASAEQIETGSSRMQPRGASEPAPAATPAIVLQMVDQRGLKVLPIFRENESAFAIESLDPPWSRSREAEILGQVAQMSGIRLLTIEVECRTSMCRLQFTQTVPVPPKVPDPVYTELLARLGYEPRLLGMARDINAGTVTYLMYLPRQ